MYLSLLLRFLLHEIPEILETHTHKNLIINDIAKLKYQKMYYLG